eukprot:scaffold38702_cov30-Tisochrysis_lutea.AAC.4
MLRKETGGDSMDGLHRGVAGLRPGAVGLRPGAVGLHRGVDGCCDDRLRRVKASWPCERADAGPLAVITGMGMAICRARCAMASGSSSRCTYRHHAASCASGSSTVSSLRPLQPQVCDAGCEQGEHLACKNVEIDGASPIVLGEVRPQRVARALGLASDLDATAGHDAEDRPGRAGGAITGAALVAVIAGAAQLATHRPALDLAQGGDIEVQVGQKVAPREAARLLLRELVHSKQKIEHLALKASLSGLSGRDSELRGIALTRQRHDVDHLLHQNLRRGIPPPRQSAHGARQLHEAVASARRARAAPIGRRHVTPLAIGHEPHAHASISSGLDVLCPLHGRLGTPRGGGRCGGPGAFSGRERVLQRDVRRGERHGGSQRHRGSGPLYSSRLALLRAVVGSGDASQLLFRAGLLIPLLRLRAHQEELVSTP